MRLTLFLTENPLTDTPETNALLALMCFQSSRLKARINDSDEFIVFEDQDKNLWDRSLIDRGNYYLVRACEHNQVSSYHIEAAIAYWHATEYENKWGHILHLYDQLIRLYYSPIIALNRTFAFAKVHGKVKATPEAEKLNLIDNSQYHKLLGYLYEEASTDKAIHHFEKAAALTASMAEKPALIKKIKQLKTIRPSESGFF